MLEYAILLPILIMIAIGSIIVALVFSLIHAIVSLFIKDEPEEDKDE